MASDSTCIFCLINRGEAEASFVHQDEWVTAFMDIRPVTTGHVLVVPRQHTPLLERLEAQYGSHMFLVGQRLAQALRHSGLRCEGVNFYLADGPAAGQTVFHSHLHIIPRHSGDGIRLLLPSDYGQHSPLSTLETTAASIRAAMAQQGSAADAT